MEEGVGEECGISGAYLKDLNLDRRIIPTLLIAMEAAVQHRGQKSAGIAVHNPLKEGETARRETMMRYKGRGLVEEVFCLNDEVMHQKIVKMCSGVAGIGHNRYSTSGIGRENNGDADDETQPFLRRHARPEKRIAISFNGNMANYDDMALKMEREGYNLETNVDTEIWMNLIAREIKMMGDGDGQFRRINLFEMLKSAIKGADGCTNLLLLFGDGNMMAYRCGFRPLIYGENEQVRAIASESVALEKIGIKNFREIKGGEALIINPRGVESEIISEANPFCRTENIYFMNGASIANGKSVRRGRRMLGEIIASSDPYADHFKREGFIVVPNPNTAIPGAEGYAETLGLPVRIAVEKLSRKRGFINPPETRAKIMDEGYIFYDDVEGKGVVIVDDCIIRGETLKKTIAGIKRRGAKEVHVRSLDYPILFPCYYGVDFPSPDELIVNNLGLSDVVRLGQVEERLAKEFGINSVRYNRMKDVLKVFEYVQGGICTACISGQYPTLAGQTNYSKSNGRSLVRKIIDD